MNEFSFRERWWASFKIWLTSERDFEILWFLALVVKIFSTILEKFQQIWNFLVNEKLKNGLPDDIWSKIGHFFISVIFLTVLRWLWKMANFWLNVVRKAIFPLFIYQKVSNLLKFFQNCQKKFWPLLLKIAKFQNLFRMSKKILTKHTIVHETKFHSFFAKQTFLHI